MDANEDAPLAEKGKSCWAEREKGSKDYFWSRWYENGAGKAG
jgi:hypothetical protein